MANIPQDLLYTEEHEYVRRTDEEDVVVDRHHRLRPGRAGRRRLRGAPQAAAPPSSRMEVFGTIEAVKAVSELFCPVAGEVVAVNDALDADPALVNTDPYGEGWMIRLRVSDPSELDSLMDAAAYEETHRLTVGS